MEYEVKVGETEKNIFRWSVKVTKSGKYPEAVNSFDFSWYPFHIDFPRYQSNMPLKHVLYYISL